MTEDARVQLEVTISKEVQERLAALKMESRVLSDMTLDELHAQLATAIQARAAAEYQDNHAAYMSQVSTANARRAEIEVEISRRIEMIAAAVR